MKPCTPVARPNKYSWTPTIRTQLFWIPRYFELQIIPLGFSLRSFTIAYFELPLFRTIFRYPCGFNCKCLIIHVIKVIFYQGSWWWRYHMTTPGWSLVLQTRIVWHRLTGQTGWTESAVLLQTILQCWYGWTHQSSPTLQSTKKTQTKCGRTRYMVHVPRATPEKFQNDVSTLKKNASNVFRPHYAQKFENAPISSQFGFVLEGNSGKEIIWLWWRHRFKFVRFEERFRKVPFSWQISVLYLYITHTILWFPNSKLSLWIYKIIWFYQLGW